MVAEAFVLFFSISTELDGGRYTISVLEDRHIRRTNPDDKLFDSVVFFGS